jgi:hypothetical protein
MHDHTITLMLPPHRYRSHAQGPSVVSPPAPGVHRPAGRPVPPDPTECAVQGMRQPPYGAAAQPYRFPETPGWDSRRLHKNIRQH